jgi:hypothetical protein
MNLSTINGALGKVKKPEEVDEVSLRYTDPMGNIQTVPIDRIVEEIPLGEDKPVRRIILIAGGVS